MRFESNPDDVVAFIRAANPKLSQTAADEIWILSQDGSTPEFIDDAGIETLADHLADLADRADHYISCGHPWPMKPTDNATWTRKWNSIKTAIETAMATLPPAGP